MDVYVDAGPGMSALGEVAAWSFDIAHWGECGQGADEQTAMSNLARRTNHTYLTIIDRIHPMAAAQVFGADMASATEEQVAVTAAIVEVERARTIDLVSRASRGQLMSENNDVQQPAWMRWRTAEAIAWHIADTESRHYVKLLGCGYRPPENELLDELNASANWIQQQLRELPRSAETEVRGETWTTTTLLRRLAWHERVESVFLRRRLQAAGMDP